MTRSAARPPLRIIDGVPEVPGDCLDFLRALEGPTLFVQPGADRARCLAVSALLHGNEPSGIRAVHEWLRSGETPETDVLFFIGAVEAALHGSPFSHRMLPGGRDLNRCFRPPFDGDDGRLAETALRELLGRRPQSLIDLHNNTGHNPAYGIARRLTPENLALVALVSPIVVFSQLRLGALVEAFVEDVPAVTLECGRAGDPAADEVAAAGLARYLRLDHARGAPGPMRILGDPVRVMQAPGLSLAFRDRPGGSADLTLTADLDRHNFQRMDAGVAIGWVKAGAPWPLWAPDESGIDLSRRFFRADDGGRLVTKVPLTPIMMTTSPAAALSDCLFYLVNDVHGAPEPERLGVDAAAGRRAAP